jgi:protein arginine N-methyltransferase 2
LNTQIDTLLQDQLHPARHTIIEAHPSVLTHIQSTPFHNKAGVEVLPGRWQDWCQGDKLAELIGKSAGGAGYDFVFIDTFAEDYEELKAFFEIVTDLLEGPESVFSFWNGLGATSEWLRI